MSEIVVFVTTKDKQEAKKIASILIEKKLAACVNIVEKIESLFWWQGKVDNSSETLLIIKTKKTLFEKLRKQIKTIHSYEVPEIIALPIVSIDKDYKKWINDVSA